MTEEEFISVNSHFNSIVEEKDLDFSLGVIDNQSILSRIHKKIDGAISSNIIGLLALFNIQLLEEKYESAIEIKEHIKKNY